MFLSTSESREGVTVGSVGSLPQDPALASPGRVTPCKRHTEPPKVTPGPIDETQLFWLAEHSTGVMISQRTWADLNQSSFLRQK